MRVYKDLNWINEKIKMNFGNHITNIFLKQIQTDTSFYQK